MRCTEENARCLKPAGAVENLNRKEKESMKYNLKKIMLNAWKNYRKYQISFAEALHRAWLSAKAEQINAERIERSKMAAGVAEETNTWAGWKKLGYEVVHGSKALFGCSLIWGSKGDGAVYKASFFGRSQVQELTATA